jgi:hypothetical protein
MRTMVLEYLPTKKPFKWPSYVGKHIGKYSSTMEHMGIIKGDERISLISPHPFFWLISTLW